MKKAAKRLNKGKNNKPDESPYNEKQNISREKDEVTLEQDSPEKVDLIENSKEKTSAQVIDKILYQEFLLFKKF